MKTLDELAYWLITDYLWLLDKIEIFGYKFPDNAEAYNFMVVMAEEKLNTMQILGISTVKPLPPKK